MAGHALVERDSVIVLARSFIVTLVILVPLVLGLTISMLGIFPFLKYLPDLAGVRLLTGYPSTALLDPIRGGLVVMATWTGAASVSASIVFERRDAGSWATVMLKLAPATIDPSRVPSFESARVLSQPSHRQIPR